MEALLAGWLRDQACRGCLGPLLAGQLRDRLLGSGADRQNPPPAA